MSIRHLVTGTLLATAMGCELDDEPAGTTDPVLVVHAVLNTALDTQFVVVESSRTGQVEPQIYPGMVPGTPAFVPLSDAEVWLEHMTPPAGCGTPVVRLNEATLESVGGEQLEETGVYLTAGWCALRPGDQARLTVRGLGQTVTGITTVPGVGTVSVGLRSGENTTDTVLVQRETDSIWISTADMTGAAVQYEVARQEHRNLMLPFDIPFTYITDTAGAVSIAGNLVMPFEGDDGTDLLQPGRYYVLTVAATDRNYFDFARSASDIFTGRGFINHLEGGVGVFGSVDPATRVLKIVAHRRTAEEGRYRITGIVAGGPVDAVLELYRTQDYGDTQTFSAFVTGSWGGLPLTSGVSDGTFGDPIRGPSSYDANFTLEILAGSLPDTVRYYLNGVRAAPGQSFQVTAFSFRQLEPVTDTLSAIQETSGQ